MEVDLTGVNDLTYPVLDTWGWEIAGYLFLGGLVGGLMVVGAVLRLRHGDLFSRQTRIADIASLPLLGGGLLLLFADLSNRWNAWRFFTTLQVSSPMSWGSWILAIACGVVVARVLVHAPLQRLARRLERRGSRISELAPLARAAERLGRLLGRHPRLLDVASIGTGVALAFYTGVLLSTIRARPLWDSAALAPLFLVSGIAAGAAFYCAFSSREQQRRLAPGTLTLCGIELLLVVAFVVSVAGLAGRGSAVEILLEGGYAVAFWGVVVGLGLVLPALIEGAEYARRHPPALLARAAPYLKLAGAAGLRFVIVAAGLQSFL